MSIEIFPPKSAEAADGLWAALGRLVPFGPEFVSVTCGAGGSGAGRTELLIRQLQERFPVEVAAHLTCVSASPAEIESLLRRYWAAGVRRIVSLRGDAPKDEAPPADAYRNATELTAATRRVAPFDISVACYPEIHPESPGLAHEIEVLKAKADAGAARALSQVFFEAETFLRFRDAADQAGVPIPIVPGVMPITAFKGARRMAAMCGASVPQRLVDRFEGLDDDLDTRRMLACAHAVETCETLRAEGVEDFHFYVLNQSEVPYAVCRALGLNDAPQRAIA
jgi:methylenetetrahydrofolate reductase (NADPH)